MKTPLTLHTVFQRLFLAGVAASVALGLAIAVEQWLEVGERRQLAKGQTFVSVGDRKVHYRLMGKDRPGPTLVLVPGFGAPLEQWEILQTNLAKDAPVLAYDRGGTGLSDLPDAFGAVAQADELAGMLRSGVFKPPFVIVCFSAASMLVRAFGERYPELAGGFVFYDPVMPQQLLDLAPEDRSESRGVYINYTTKEMIKTVVGGLRIKRWLKGETGLKTSYLSSHHYAAFREGIRYEQSARESLSFPATKAPIGMLSVWLGQTRSFHIVTYRLHHEMAALSPKHVFLDIPGQPHGQLVANPANLSRLLGLARDVLALAREGVVTDPIVRKETRGEQQ